MTAVKQHTIAQPLTLPCGVPGLRRLGSGGLREFGLKEWLIFIGLVERNELIEVCDVTRKCRAGCPALNC